MIRLLSTLTQTIENASTSKSFLSPTSNIYRRRMDHIESNLCRRYFSDSTKVRISCSNKVQQQHKPNHSHELFVDFFLLQNGLILLKPNNKKYAFYDLDGEPPK